MSQENVELVRRCYELWEQRDFRSEILEELLDAHFVFDLSRNVFNPDVYRGHEGFRRYVEAVEEAWEDFEGTPLEFIDWGDRVVTAVRISGRGRRSGVEVEWISSTSGSSARKGLADHRRLSRS